MRCFAVVNQKGGSGKTTTAVNLAAGLAAHGRRVLLIDLDPQASASRWFRAAEEGRGLLGLFTNGGRLTQLVHGTDVDGVWLVPASNWLVAADKVLAEQDGAELMLRRELESVDGAAWDYVLMDCPPTLGVLTVSALAAATEVLVPVEAHVLPLHGLVQLLETIEVVRGRLNPALRIAGIVACRVDRRTRHALEVVEELRERFGDLVYGVVIRENVRLAECPSFGKPIFEYARRSAGAADYAALATEILNQEAGV